MPLTRRQIDALKWANGDDVPDHAVKGTALVELSYRGFVTVEGIGEDEQKVTITEAGRKALAENR